MVTKMMMVVVVIMMVTSIALAFNGLEDSSNNKQDPDGWSDISNGNSK